MTITSFYFLALVAFGALVFYLVPKKVQWIELLVLSLVFYWFAAVPVTIIYLVAATGIAYLATALFDRLKESENSRKAAFWVAVCAVFINVLIWFVVKGSELWAPVLEKINGILFSQRIDSIINANLIAALGMGYYTLQILGYIIDCYWGNMERQKNPLKLFLFVAYFPQLTTGPINRYKDMNSLFEGHKFNLTNISFGAQRILWGFFKKLVIAERVGQALQIIIANPDGFFGFYSWILVLLYPLQMYADFSGCMDIVLGVSEIFDIKMAENFNNPFFSRTSQEFWQRWHMTLGGWAKDYVFYPLLTTKGMGRFGRFAKKKYGKRTGKFLMNLIGSFALWFVMGIWHGAPKYIIGVSLWYFVILMLGDLLAPVFEKVTAALHMKTESFGYHRFQSVRTYFIYAVGATFFCLGVRRGLDTIKDMLKCIVVRNYGMPWIFFDGSMLNLFPTYKDMNILIIGIIFLIIAGILREKNGYARIWIAKQSFGFRWLVWIVLFVLVLIYGKYGPGYNAADFIYQGF